MKKCAVLIGIMMFVTEIYAAPVKQGIFDNVPKDDKEPQVNPDNSKKTGFNSQIEITKIDISPLKHAYGTNIIYGMLTTDGTPDCVLRFAPDGMAYLGFSDKDFNTYIYKLDSKMKISGKPLIKIAAKRFENFIITENGIALAVASWVNESLGTEYYTYFNHLYFRLYSMNGSLIHENYVVGCGIWENIGDQSYGGDGIDIVWTGDYYALYFTTYKKAYDGVVHESEYLTFLNPDGEQLKDQKGYDLRFPWNVSHSFRPHLEYYETEETLMMVTMGDAYPIGMAAYTHKKELENFYENGITKVIYDVSIEQGDNDTHVSIGDTMIVDEGMLIVADNKEGLSGYDLCMFYLYPDCTHKGPIWLTKTPNNFERLPKVAMYGKNYFIAWGEQAEWSDFKSHNGEYLGSSFTECYAMVVSPDGKVIVPKQKLDVHFRGNSEFFNYENGDIGWIDSTQSDQYFNLIRLKVAE
ncbi:MAG: hypothetical protein A2Y33_05935 [Spirochaetes bacterium GWF1_51_8]|nr:MAG: hypothetical protein A2Y33_05935 [Spirochaetes bacterium GWF1_51_8]